MNTFLSAESRRIWRPRVPLVRTGNEVPHVRRILATIGAHGETLALVVEALVRADGWKESDERSELRKALPVQCTGILDNRDVRLWTVPPRAGEYDAREA
jgi:hypothetical protein